MMGFGSISILVTLILFFFAAPRGKAMTWGPFELPRYQDDRFKRTDKKVLTLWPEIPFFVGGDLGQYEDTMKQTRDSERQMFMEELLSALERLGDKGGAVDLMLEPMANILMMFDQVHDIHKNKDVINIDKSLEAQFLASMDERFRRFDVREDRRKFQFSKGTDPKLLEAYIREISRKQPLGRPITQEELKIQVALEMYEQIDYFAYGTFSGIGRGQFQITFHLTNSKSGVQRAFIARGPLLKTIEQLVQEVFDHFQKNIYPDWETPDWELAWLPVPVNAQKKEGYTWGEAQSYCRNRGYRLPYARELLMAESGGTYKEGGIQGLEAKVSYPVMDRRLSTDHYVFTPGNEGASGGPIQAASYTMTKGLFWCTKGVSRKEVLIFEDVWSLIRKYSLQKDIYRALETVRHRLGDFGTEEGIFFRGENGVTKLERYDTLTEALGVLRTHKIKLEIPKTMDLQDLFKR